MCFWKDFGRNSSQPPEDGETDSISAVDSDDNIDPSETAPILPSSSSIPIKTIARRLYVSHFLSTWNSRIFEFGAVLYLATIFPETLLPMSVYAVARGASAIVFGSLVGQIIDKWDRLVVVRLSIVLQRGVVAASLVVFWVLAREMVDGKQWKVALLGLLTVLACIEKLASIMNLISVERDWVVSIAQDNQEYLPGERAQSTQTLALKLTIAVMNSQMRRIDLICKLLGPFVIALIDGVSTEIAILVNLGVNLASIPLEYLFIAQIYRRVPQLQRHSADNQEQVEEDDEDRSRRSSRARKLLGGLSKVGRVASLYFKHPAFMPSFACALLYLTVLSFSGQMVTYLISIGYTSTHVAIARTVSVCFEVMATWVGPWLMSKIGAVRAGLWFASWQSGCLLVGISVFWNFQNQDVIAASALVGSTILSRLGLWGFDLCAQLIIQDVSDPPERSSCWY